MKIVVIESPYAGDVDRNLRYLRAAMRDCLAHDEAPYASHALYTQPSVLDDNVPDERKRGMRAGFEFHRVADIVAVYDDLGVTRGMNSGISHARKFGCRIERRSLGEDWDG